MKTLEKTNKQKKSVKTGELRGLWEQNCAQVISTCKGGWSFLSDLPPGPRDLTNERCYQRPPDSQPEPRALSQAPL